MRPTSESELVPFLYSSFLALPHMCYISKCCSSQVLKLDFSQLCLIRSIVYCIPFQDADLGNRQLHAIPPSLTTTFTPAPSCPLAKLTDVYVMTDPQSWGILILNMVILLLLPLSRSRALISSQGEPDNGWFSQYICPSG
jgi:hypothetical protein